MACRSALVSLRFCINATIIVVTSIGGFAIQSLAVVADNDRAVGITKAISDQPQDPGEKAIVRRGFVNEPFEFDNLSVKGEKLPHLGYMSLQG